MSAELDVLRREIGEQPRVVGALLDEQRTAVQAVAGAIRRRQPTTIVFVARGSSDNAAVYGRYLFEVCNRQLTSLAAPSGLTLYGRGPRLDGTVVIGVSQSGQGEDVVSYMRAARNDGALTVAVVNDHSSPLADSAEWVLDCRAGSEVSVPATKTVTAQMTLLAMLSAAVDDLDDAVFASLTDLPGTLERAVGLWKDAAEIAALLAPTTLGSVIGRGFAYPPALEIALKLKETSYTAAEPFSAADFLHGPVALVDRDFSAVVLDVGGRSSDAAQTTAESVEARGGQAIQLCSGQVARYAGAALVLPSALEESVAPIPLIVLGQLLAVELALARGLDPARPRGLRKVTSTR